MRSTAGLRSFNNHVSKRDFNADFKLIRTTKPDTTRLSCLPADRRCRDAHTQRRYTSRRSASNNNEHSTCVQLQAVNNHTLNRDLNADLEQQAS